MATTTTISLRELFEGTRQAVAEDAGQAVG